MLRSTISYLATEVTSSVCDPTTQHRGTVTGTHLECYWAALLAHRRGLYAQGDSDVISIRIYAGWFSPPSCG